MPKRMSERQLAANRQNALKSTGPRTVNGRAASKMNALKHGILSSQVLVKSLHYKESQRDFEALHQRFSEDLKPVGPVEEMLVDQIVSSHWRLRRALQAESGEISLSLSRSFRSRTHHASPSMQWMQWQLSGDAGHAMGQTSIGCAVLMSMLESVAEAVQQHGSLSQEIIDQLGPRLGGKTSRFVRRLEDLLKHQEDCGATDGKSLPEPPAVLDFLNQEINRLRLQRDACVNAEEAEHDAQVAASVLPAADTLDKILRYETKLERQLYRAMAQLERLQRMRHGEAIPAPLSVEVSGQG